MFVINEQFVAVAELAGGGGGIESAHDGLRGLVVHHLHHPGGAVGMRAQRFDLIPAVAGMLKFTVKDACIHKRLRTTGLLTTRPTCIALSRWSVVP